MMGEYLARLHANGVGIPNVALIGRDAREVQMEDGTADLVLTFPVLLSAQLHSRAHVRGRVDDRCP
jgi:hypothetical protein